MATEFLAEFHKEKFDNIMNSKKIKKNMIFMATFILLYESFEDRLQKYVKEDPSKWEPDEENEECKRCQKAYNMKNRKKAGILRTLEWYKNEGAIDDKDYNTFVAILETRNNYVHAMDEQLYDGILESSKENLKKLRDLYEKVNLWISERQNGNEVLNLPLAFIIASSLFNDNIVNNIFKKIKRIFKK